VLLFFEWDLKASGGIWKLTEQSRFAGTWVLDCSVYLHLLFSISTAVIWLGLVGFSALRFSNPPAPGAFSRVHRFWGRLGMIDMILTGITGVELYVVGFAL
jgi:hypothetical protein